MAEKIKNSNPEEIESIKTNFTAKWEWKYFEPILDFVSKEKDQTVIIFFVSVFKDIIHVDYGQDFDKWREWEQEQLK